MIYATQYGQQRISVYEHDVSANDITHYLKTMAGS